MLKVDAITFFGSKTKLANAAGVRLASVAAWGISGHHLTEKYVATTVA